MYFDKHGDLVLEEEKGRRKMIPIRYVHMIWLKLKEGKDYQDASPIFSITREQAAFILTEYKGYYYGSY